MFGRRLVVSINFANSIDRESHRHGCLESDTRRSRAEAGKNRQLTLTEFMGMRRAQHSARSGQYWTIGDAAAGLTECAKHRRHEELHFASRNSFVVKNSLAPADIC